jgi:putative spermidine/putrescine transport system substrate-binding protein
MRKTAITAVLAATGALAFGVAGCGDDSSSGGGTIEGGGSNARVKPPPGLEMQKSLGKGEGEVDLIAWAGYVEDGSTDPKVDWVSDFEKQTGCKVNVKVGNTSDEMVTLMRTGDYDGVSASGDATLRLIAGGDVAPVNTDLVPNYKDVYPALKNQSFNSVEGQMYGIPHGRGANLLMWNKDVIKPDPDSWSAVFDPDPANKGKVTAYDSPIYIADAALYLKATQPDLGITDPYELDDKQFNAAIDLLKKQRESIGSYWSDYTKEQSAFNNGDSTVGTTWQVIANLLDADGNVKVGTTLPKEGSTGWSDTWMISSKAKHPNCMYMWMDHIISPKANAAVAEWFGEAPSNPKACPLTAVKDHCKIFHANDEPYFKRVSFWTTPTKNCGDDRGAVCKDYSEWVSAWTEVKG